MSRVSFVISPMSGMGGRVGPEGADDTVGNAGELGTEPVAHSRALEALREFKRRFLDQTPLLALDGPTYSNGMGADTLAAIGIESSQIVVELRNPTSADDTKGAMRRFSQLGVDFILFASATARDIASVAGVQAPILGSPPERRCIQASLG